MPNLQSLLQKLLLSEISSVFHSKYGLSFVPGTLPPHRFPWVWWDVIWKQLAALSWKATETQEQEEGVEALVENGELQHGGLSSAASEETP